MWITLFAIGQNSFPNLVTISLHHAVSAAEFEGFLGMEAGMDAAEYDPGSSFAGQSSYLHPPQRIGGVNPTANDIAGFNALVQSLNITVAAPTAGIAAS